MKGIDKTISYNYKVASIDFEKLRLNLNEGVSISTEGLTRNIIDRRTGELVKVGHILIKDDMFGNLSIGVKAQNIVSIEYCNLEISLKSYDGDNIRPMGVKKFKEMREKILTYVDKRYGIKLIEDESRFKVLELNSTIPLNKESKEYHYLFSMIELLLPKNYGNASCGEEVRTEKEMKEYKETNKTKGRYRFIGPDNTIETMYFYNGDIEGKIYLKSEQIKKVYGIDTEENLLRIEYTLKNERKVKNIFGDNFIEDISDEKIIEFLDKQIEKDIIKPLEKHIKKAPKQLKALAEEEKAKDSRKWTRMFVAKAGQLTYDKVTPVLVDIEYQTKEYLKKELKKNYKRSIARLEDDFQFIRKNSYSSGTIELYQEIKEKCSY